MQNKYLKRERNYSIIILIQRNPTKCLFPEKVKGENIMKVFFGNTPSGEAAWLYTISCGRVTAKITNYGAALVRLFVPDKEGQLADVVLGFDNARDYYPGGAFLGATVGRNANRVRNARFDMNGKTVTLTPNERTNNLHSGPDSFNLRLWTVEKHSENSITFLMDSPDGDQGFPGNAVIRVTYTLEAPATLRITYDGICDQDTVFNMTNHSYFNLAGHEKTGAAMEQVLTLSGNIFTPDDAENLPTGELRNVEGTPMDFRSPKPIGKDIGADYEPLHLQGGYDHNWEVTSNPCAILEDPISGRRMEVHTDCPGIQFYAGNFLNEKGKDGIYYGKRSGVALETQFFPDSVNHPQWQQPFVKAGERYHSETCYIFT